MMKEPGLQEDAKNLGLVGGSAVVAVLITAGLLFAGTRQEPREITVRVIAPVHTLPVVPEVPAAPEPIEFVEVEIVAPLVGINRIYGTVTSRSGREYTGFIRWDRNEGSWTDFLDAMKPNGRGGENISGIRFGHVSSIEVLNDHSALFTLKSGEQLQLNSRASDLGTGLRALIVDQPDGGSYEFSWRDLDIIDFLPVPSAHKPNEARLYGTMTTRSGMEFTGFVTWDVDEIYTTDILDGDLDGHRQRIPFGSIESIERFSSRASLVTLKNGDEFILDGSNDVNSSISGISVSDPALGQVKLRWHEFDRVVFHGTNDENEFVDFDGGRRIQGTVVTESGEEITGEIRWDDDEAYTWEMLDGDIRDIEFKIEFSNIDRIVKSNRGATVTLRDGREFNLDGSNDVDDGNRGIIIQDNGRTYEVEWDDFRELRIIY
ncbi:MAG: hypothetical protein IIB36_17925 [Gemmatimonadetes bacterium]|nr:hypothetical protein [Gemmatimonadota bacterium]